MKRITYLEWRNHGTFIRRHIFDKINWIVLWKLNSVSLAFPCYRTRRCQKSISMIRNQAWVRVCAMWRNLPFVLIPRVKKYSSLRGLCVRSASLLTKKILLRRFDVTRIHTRNTAALCDPGDAVAISNLIFLLFERRCSLVESSNFPEPSAIMLESRGKKFQERIFLSQQVQQHQDSSKGSRSS